jgi:hypothetical protein
VIGHRIGRRLKDIGVWILNGINVWMLRQAQKNLLHQILDIGCLPGAPPKKARERRVVATHELIESAAAGIGVWQGGHGGLMGAP